MDTCHLGWRWKKELEFLGRAGMVGPCCMRRGSTEIRGGEVTLSP